MSSIISNPMFSSIVSLLAGSALWYGLSEEEKEGKKQTFSLFLDSVFYFVLVLFGINGLVNVRDIIEVPYGLLLFSSEVVFLATLLTAGFLAFKYGRFLFEKPEKTLSIALLYTAVGLVNHLYIYYLFGSAYSLRFVLLFALTLGLLSVSGLRKKLNGLLLFSGFGVSHVLLMGGRSVIYFNFVFHPLPLLLIFAVTSGIIFVRRGTGLSQLN
ncbi:hypothetical protein ADIAL_0100 [Alkalibacterium sp. AK22]|uniref:hypothetical protein n=1 Tax=Alkalibacterium sp. AK22 TaxID=1229520 RepID=UPI00045175D5|nr:hypothetical protein [Alkalibacterium sp. AK22]EXJ24361.1 hypothetical protein ADIAL_0100 [Alkalibacterium sp. AK22]